MCLARGSVGGDRGEWMSGFGVGWDLPLLCEQGEF